MIVHCTVCWQYTDNPRGYYLKSFKDTLTNFKQDKILLRFWLTNKCFSYAQVATRLTFLATFLISVRETAFSLANYLKDSIMSCYHSVLIVSNTLQSTYYIPVRSTYFSIQEFLFATYIALWDFDSWDYQFQ